MIKEPCVDIILFSLLSFVSPWTIPLKIHPYMNQELLPLPYVDHQAEWRWEVAPWNIDYHWEWGRDVEPWNIECQLKWRRDVSPRQKAQSIRADGPRPEKSSNQVGILKNRLPSAALPALARPSTHNFDAELPRLRGRRQHWLSSMPSQSFLEWYFWAGS